jgi:hypothetical protein
MVRQWNKASEKQGRGAQQHKPRPKRTEMMNEDYIPGGNRAFHEWQQFLTEKVTANGAAWNIQQSVIDEQTTQNAVYNTLYANIKIKQVRTTQQVDAHKVGRRSYTTFLRQLVQGYLVNNPLIPFDEKRAMGLNPREGRGKREKIVEIPVVSLVAIGGAFMRFEVRMPGTSGRARMNPLSNGVELRVYFTKGGNSAPRLSEEGQQVLLPIEAREVHTLLSTRAIFTKDTKMQGYTMHVQARYVNTVDPEKSGPWSNEVTMVVS